MYSQPAGRLFFLLTGVWPNRTGTGWGAGPGQAGWIEIFWFQFAKRIPRFTADKKPSGG